MRTQRARTIITMLRARVSVGGCIDVCLTASDIFRLMLIVAVDVWHIVDELVHKSGAVTVDIAAAAAK